MINDPVSDGINPPGTRDDNFIQIRFDDLNDGELFWLSRTVNHLPPDIYSKINVKQGVHVKTRDIIELGKRDFVYQRT